MARAFPIVWRRAGLIQVSLDDAPLCPRGLITLEGYIIIQKIGNIFSFPLMIPKHELDEVATLLGKAVEQNDGSGLERSQALFRISTRINDLMQGTALDTREVREELAAIREALQGLLD